MGQRGPQPKPTKLHALEGNPSKKALPKNELQPGQLAGRPDWLQGQAVAEWDRLVAAMPPGFFTSADMAMMTVYCTAWQNYRNAQITIDREGLESAGAQGQTVAHPAVAIAAKQAEIMLKAADRMGLSPAARTRLEMPDQKPTSKFGSLIGGRTG